MQIAQPRAGSLESFVRPDDPDVVPHQAPDLVPIVINHDELIHILDISRFPFRERNRPRGVRCWLFADQGLAGAMCHDQPLEEGIARQAIRAVQTVAGHFADRIKTGQRRRPIHVRFDAAALIVRGGDNRDRLLGHIDPETQAGFVNMRKTLLQKLG